MPLKRVNQLFILFCIFCCVLMALPFCHLIFESFTLGMNHLSWEFITQEPTLSGRKGGVAPIVVSTLLLIVTTLAIVVPLGLFVTVCIILSRRRGYMFGEFISTGLDFLVGLPSIVFGLFGYAFFCKFLNLGYSILAGALTLSLMALPYFISSLSHSIQKLPHQYRLGGLALGLSDLNTLLKVELPATKRGVVLAILLGMSRAMAETAALLFTSGYATRWPESLLDSGRALSVHIFDLAMNVPGGSSRAYSSAIILLVLVFLVSGFFNVLVGSALTKRGHS